MPTDVAPRGAVLTALMVGAVAACGGGDPVPELLHDEQALRRGQALFVGTCSGYCHVEGRANGEAPNLFDAEWRHGGSNGEIFETISNGVPGTLMVGFADVLPEGEDDIWKVIAFLRSRGP